MKKDKEIKEDICWAMFNGKTMLPFTIRQTRKQCKEDYQTSLADEPTYIRGFYEGWLSCRKVIVKEAR